MTHKHYAEPAAVTNAATARVLGMLTNTPAAAALGAEELMQHLDDDMMEKLAELFSGRTQTGRPKY